MASKATKKCYPYHIICPLPPETITIRVLFPLHHIYHTVVLSYHHPTSCNIKLLIISKNSLNQPIDYVPAVVQLEVTNFGRSLATLAKMWPVFCSKRNVKTRGQQLSVHTCSSILPLKSTLETQSRSLTDNTWSPIGRVLATLMEVAEKQIASVFRNVLARRTHGYTLKQTVGPLNVFYRKDAQARYTAFRLVIVDYTLISSTYRMDKASMYIMSLRLLFTKMHRYAHVSRTFHTTHTHTLSSRASNNFWTAFH